ncbi:MAG: hypothetical protein EOM52_00020 [Clostridia bacterium]|nr:hypothetical protein [Clostridia bacterium]
MEKQRFSMERPILIKLLACFAVILAFWFIPPMAPLTQIGMRVIGVFIGVILLLSLVDTVWPAMLAVVLLSRAGVCSINEAIAGSMGSWIIYFVLMSFIMTYALNESGFTDRLVAKFMSIKFVSKSPWIFTISLGVLGMLLGCFMDQVPATAFMLAFVGRIYKELGYEGKDSYPHVANILTVFGVNIGGAMTPISHSLAILGIGIYEGATGQSLSLFSYLAFGVPTGLVLFVILCVAMRLLAKPDMSKFKDFKVENVLKKQGPMSLREGTTAAIFFLTVLMWILPGILSMVTTAPWVAAFNKFGIVFWAVLSVVAMSIISINGKPLLDTKTVVNKSINWGILIFISIGVYLGSAMSAESTGIIAAIQANIVPLTEHVPALVVVLIIATVSVLMTNFASNVSTITVMTGVGVALALSSNGAINPVGIALVTSMSGACAYLLPSSFATIAMLHGNEYSEKKQIYFYGVVMIIVTSLVISFVGYPLGCALTGG